MESSDTIEIQLPTEQDEGHKPNLLPNEPKTPLAQVNRKLASVKDETILSEVLKNVESNKKDHNEVMRSPEELQSKIKKISHELFKKGVIQDYNLVESIEGVKTNKKCHRKTNSKADDILSFHDFFCESTSLKKVDFAEVNAIISKYENNPVTRKDSPPALMRPKLLNVDVSTPKKSSHKIVSHYRVDCQRTPKHSPTPQRSRAGSIENIKPNKISFKDQDKVLKQSKASPYSQSKPAQLVEKSPIKRINHASDVNYSEQKPKLHSIKKLEENEEEIVLQIKVIRSPLNPKNTKVISKVEEPPKNHLLKTLKDLKRYLDKDDGDNRHYNKLQKLLTKAS